MPVGVHDDLVRPRWRANVEEAGTDRARDETICACNRCRRVVQPSDHARSEEVPIRVHNLPEHSNSGDQADRHRGCAAHVDVRLVGLVERRGGAELEHACPEGQVRVARRVGRVRPDELRLSRWVRDVEGCDRRSGNWGAGALDMDLEDLRWDRLQDQAEVDSRRAGPVEPLGNRRRVAVVTGSANRDRIAAGRRRKRIDPARVRRRGQSRVDSVRIDEGDHRPRDGRGDRGARAYGAANLARPAGDEGKEGRHAERQHEEHREGSDCPVTARTHSGFSSLAQSTVPLHATRSRGRRMRRIE